MKDVFQDAAVPARHRRNPFAARARWLTWSAAAVRRVAHDRRVLEGLPRPKEVSIRGCEPYDLTFSYSWSRIPEPAAALASEFAEGLMRVRPGRDMLLLTGMLDRPFSSGILHRLFALIRVGITRLSGDARAALHSPVPASASDDGFPLHSDLFLTERLLLVFDRVRRDEGGQSLFLSRPALLEALEQSAAMPPAPRRRVGAIMHRRPQRDSFDELYALLHDTDHPWARPIARTLKRRQSVITFDPGEGYLLNDRQWLHGRLPLRGRVSTARFRRLVYGTPIRP